MTVALIWGQASGGVIGADGALPWHLPEDMRLFRALTWGSTVVMGRLTWESLPERMRPLPGRDNVVLTRRTDWAPDGARIVHSRGEMLRSYDGDLWVIGGSSVYAEFLPHADLVVRTDVDLQVAGDTYAPAVPDDWRQVFRSPEKGWATSSNGVRYAWTELVPPGSSRRESVVQGVLEVNASPVLS
jgi:dihydrofolate reductase